MDVSSEPYMNSDEETEDFSMGMVPPTQVTAAFKGLLASTQDMVFNKTTSSIILKGVFGKVPEREPLVEMLHSKFHAQTRSLSSLTYIEVMEVMARKLVSLNYVKMLSPSGEIKVIKEIDI